MRVTLMVPGSLVPAELAAELAAALAAPALASSLVHAGRATESAAAPGLAEADWLAREVFGSSSPPPTAPYARAALGGAADERQIWHADPIHVGIQRESLVVCELGVEEPADDEADALMVAANALCAEAGCELQRVGSEWFLASDREWSLRPRPLAAMIGASMPLPAAEEADALHWSRLHNAIQMTWHGHPVNQAREGRGTPVINGIWLHGGGRWRPLAPLRWSRVHSRRAALRGAARAAGVAVAAEDQAPQTDALLVWDEALEARRQMDWAAWIEAMRAIDRRLKRLGEARIELVLAGERRLKQWRVRSTDRFRLWRRQALAEALAE